MMKMKRVMVKRVMVKSKVQPMSVLPADPMADVFFGTLADVRSDVFSRHKQCPQKRKLVLTYH